MLELQSEVETMLLESKYLVVGQMGPRIHPLEKLDNCCVFFAEVLKKAKQVPVFAKPLVYEQGLQTMVLRRMQTILSRRARRDGAFSQWVK